MSNDLMSNIEWFFSLHDKDKDGTLTKDEVLHLSESLLVSVLLHSAIGWAQGHPSSFSVTKSVTPTWVLLVAS